MKKLIFIFVVNILVLSFAFSGIVMGEENLPVLRVGVTPYYLSLPVRFLVENGLDIKNGYKVKSFMFDTGSPINEGLAASELDCGTLSGAGIFGVANFDCSIIAAIADSTWGQDMVVRPDSEILSVRGYNPKFPDVYGSPETVKGKTFLLPIGTVMHWSALEWLKAIDIKDAEVNVVHMDPNTAFEAYLAGNGDIVGLWPSINFNAYDKGFKKASSLKKLGLLNLDLIIASNRAIEEKPELLAKFISDIYEVISTFLDNPQLAFEELKQYYADCGQKITDKWVAAEVAKRPFFSFEKIMEEMYPDTVVGAIRSEAEFFASQEKLLEEQLGLFVDGKGITNEILKRAYEIYKK